MKHFSSLILSFSYWLETLNYAQSTIYQSPRYVREFLQYLESRNCKAVKDINNDLVQSYFTHLSQRKNRRKDGSLSLNYIQGNVNALRRFGKYLRESQSDNIEIEINIPKADNNKVVLTKAEILSLYRSTGNGILGSRDQAMLAIFYGCGLRRSEGLSLNTADILINKKLIYVRKGKNYKERYIPVNGKTLKYIENYLFKARPYLLNGKENKAFFLSIRGNRLSGNSMIHRLKLLQKSAKIKKDMVLHSLRHSIATHLLQAGMKLEQISKFLGHSTLESTQIYTQVALM